MHGFAGFFCEIDSSDFSSGEPFFSHELLDGSSEVAGFALNGADLHKGPHGPAGFSVDAPADDAERGEAFHHAFEARGFGESNEMQQGGSPIAFSAVGGACGEKSEAGIFHPAQVGSQLIDEFSSGGFGGGQAPSGAEHL